MAKAALIVKDTGEIIQMFDDAIPQRVALPGVGQVSPATIGWEGSGFAIVEVVHPEIPDGKVADGTVEYSIEDGKLIGDVAVKDAPASAPLRDIFAELDALTARVAKLETGK